MRSLVPLLALVPVSACAPLMAPSPERVQPAAGQPTAGADSSTNRLPRRNERARVVFPAGPSGEPTYLVGWVHTLRADTLILVRGLQVDTVKLGGSRQLQVVVRQRSHAKLGAIVGFGVGAVAGAVIADAAYEPCPAPRNMVDVVCSMVNDRGSAAAGGLLLGGLAGGLLGWAIGSAFITQEWGTVTLPPAAVTVGPGRVGLRVTF